MKIGIIVLCRFSSSRLLGKILIDVNGKPILQHILDRLKLVSNADQVIVATSNDNTDEPIKDFCAQHDIPVFRGSLNNVASRFLACAQHYGFDYAIRINGDNLFIDHSVIVDMIEIAKQNKYDLISNVPGRTFPYGMSVEILRTQFYQSIIYKISDTPHQEHVTSYLYDSENLGNRFIYLNNKVPEARGIQLAIDTPEDLHKAKALLEDLSNFGPDIKLKEIFEKYKNL